jgi:hypothetical protein
MPSRMIRKKPLLTEQMRIQRLEFANAYRHWDEDDLNPFFCKKIVVFKFFVPRSQLLRC